MVVKEEKISEEMNQEKTNSSKMLPHRDQMNRPKNIFVRFAKKVFFNWLLWKCMSSSNI